VVRTPRTRPTPHARFFGQLTGDGVGLSTPTCNATVGGVPGTIPNEYSTGREEYSRRILHGKRRGLRCPWRLHSAHKLCDLVWAWSCGECHAGHRADDVHYWHHMAARNTRRAGVIPGEYSCRS
jgi:hypothetical protein